MHLSHIYCKIKQWIHGDDKSHKLIKIVHRSERWSGDDAHDYFVYRAGAAAGARPPSLSLLPTHDISGRLLRGLRPWHPRGQMLLDHTTGLLRRGEDEALVVELEFGDKSTGGMANLNVLRLGSSEWELRSAVPIVLGCGGGSRGEGYGNKDLMSPDHMGGTRLDFFPDRVVPVGDRFLCWVKYSSGILVCDQGF